MAAIFNLPLSSMSESVHSSLDVLLDPKNVGVAFGIWLLSCIEAKVLSYFICTFGNKYFISPNVEPQNIKSNTKITCEKMRPTRQQFENIRKCHYICRN